VRFRAVALKVGCRHNLAQVGKAFEHVIWSEGEPLEVATRCRASKHKSCL
jgi:hypothetical protein